MDKLFSSFAICKLLFIMHIMHDSCNIRKNRQLNAKIYLSTIVKAVQSLHMLVRMLAEIFIDLFRNFFVSHFYRFAEHKDVSNIWVYLYGLILVVLVWPLCFCVPSMFRQHRIDIVWQYDHCTLHFCTLGNSFCIFFSSSNYNRPPCIYFFVRRFSFPDQVQVGDKLVEFLNFLLNFVRVHESF